MKGFKFRVWDIERECYLDEAELAGITPDGKYILYIEEEEISRLEIDDNYVVEFNTGLKDKKGKGIYEGDILEFDNDFDDSAQRYVPFFNEKLSAFGFKIYGYQDYISESGSEEFESEMSLIGEMENYEREEIISYTEHINIVGNIHENADLLENK